MYTETGRFEWDDAKARRNALKHGVGFREAATAFGDPDYLISDDPLHSRDEDRVQLLGRSAQGRLLLVVFTVRQHSVIRLISARDATQTERAHYEEQ